MIELASWIMIVSGSIFMVIGAIGAVRLPDFWSRLHAVSVTDTGGVILLIIGMSLQAGFSLVTFKLVMIGIFIFITGPTASHAVANAALVSGLLPKGKLLPGMAEDQAKEIGAEFASDKVDPSDEVEGR
jgi:multicomponent Na+:H+ antiporter subunit G